MASIDAEDVIKAFMSLLGRYPESDAVIASFIEMQSHDTMIDSIRSSQEYKQIESIKQMQNHSLISAMVQYQISPWFGQDSKIGALSDRLISLSVENPVFVYAISNDGVTIASRPSFRGLEFNEGVGSVFNERGNYYLKILSESLTGVNFEKSCVLAIRVDDEAPDYHSLPVFSFQKKTNQKNILLPDFEFVSQNYHLEIRNVDISLEQKRPCAIFTGATTGIQHMTLDVVRSNLNDRIRAARFFKDSNYVKFYLPNIVQCSDVEAVKFLESEGFGSGRISWEESLKYRYIISMDGNGATCSRLAIALNSESILIKYHSENELYYTPFLQPWYHYIPVRKDADVEEVIEADLMCGGKFNYIGLNGKTFAQAYLNRASIQAYVRMVVMEYASVFFS